MASIGRGNLKCKERGCGRVRPYWADKCKRHREQESSDESVARNDVIGTVPGASVQSGGGGTAAQMPANTRELARNGSE